MVLYSFVFVVFFLNEEYFFKDKCEYGKHDWRLQFCSSFSSSPTDRYLERQTDSQI